LAFLAVGGARCKRAGAEARFIVAAPAFFAGGHMRIDFFRPPL
jgi:hypothetical protein